MMQTMSDDKTRQRKYNIEPLASYRVLTKLKVSIIRADVVEGTHKSFQNESYSHGVVDTKELRKSMILIKLMINE